MKCPKCGAELTEDTKFCSFCGEKIEHHSDDVHQQNISNNSFGKDSKTSEDMKTLKSNTQSEKKSLADNLKEKAIEYWNCLSIFGKIVAVSITVFAILALVGFLSGKTSAGIISLVQITMVVVAILMNKEVIKAPNNWAKYAVLSAAILFTVLNIKSYSWENVINTKPSTSLNNTTVQTAPGVTAKSESASNEGSETTETNLTIEKDSQYAYMSDEWNVYIATAISDSLVKIESWKKTLSSSKSVKYDHDIGTFKINDIENGFSWIDEEHTAFYMTLQDKENNRLKKSKTVLFTININDSDKNKGSDYDENIICYSYKNDDWHLYRAIPLTENLVKIEVWTRSSSADKFLYGYDMCVINPNSTDTDFDWTDDEHTSFTITTQDPDNDSYWKTPTFVAFTAENDNCEYNNVKSFLGSKIVGEGEIAVPSSASSYNYKNYEDVEQELSSVGFTNISIEILYDIVLGWTDEGEVESVSIDGKKDYEQDAIFKQDAPIVITYHMKEEDDPAKKSGESTEASGTTQESESVTEDILTVDNCPELAAILSMKAESDPSYVDFASKYNGRKIEFDGSIDYLTNHENYKTRYEMLVSAGDYDENHQIGPTFKFEEIATYEIDYGNQDQVTAGTNVHIIAEVESFNTSSQLFFLKPVSVSVR